jgi:hypothetical protein
MTAKKWARVARVTGCIAFTLMKDAPLLRAEGAEQKSIESAQQSTPAPDALTEPAHVRTVIIQPNEAERKQIESGRAWPGRTLAPMTWLDNMRAVPADHAAKPPPAPDPLTDPKHVRTVIIPTNPAERWPAQPTRPPTASSTLAEPERSGVAPDRTN